MTTGHYKVPDRIHDPYVDTCFVWFRDENALSSRLPLCLGVIYLHIMKTTTRNFFLSHSFIFHYHPSSTIKSISPHLFGKLFQCKLVSGLL